MIKKYIYSICKCGKEKQTPNRPYCRECCGTYYKESKKIKESLSMNLDKEILDFIDRVESRNGMVTLNEIFVDLIEYYSRLKSDGEISYEIDILPPKDQLSIMWTELLRWKRTQQSN